jgi:glycine cleavage system H protein
MENREMSERPQDCFYTEDHEWIKKEGDLFLVGITDYAQQELGDVVYVDLPPSGGSVQRSDTMFTVESVKAVSDIYAPVSGEIVDVNERLSDEPQLVNDAPFTDGWMIKMRISDESTLEALMTADKYNELIDQISK